MGWFTDAVAWVRSRIGGGPRPEPPAPGQLTSVDALVERMHEIERALPAGDGVAVFNRMYLRVTELVRDRLVEGSFGNPVFVTRLDLVFAGLYLDAVRAGTPDASWIRATVTGSISGMRVTFNGPAVPWYSLSNWSLHSERLNTSSTSS